MKHSIDYWSNELPKCPHCDKDFQVWSYDHPVELNYEDGGRTMFECDSCGNEFACVTNVKYTFSTAVSDDAADDEEWGPQEATAA
ncbi:transposase-like protein [Bradyrhizobium sp. USDA 4472]